MIMISHDIHQIVANCDRVLVMWRGKALECIAANQIFSSTHPYTSALVNCLPSKEKRGMPLPEIDYDKITDILC